MVSGLFEGGALAPFPKSGWLSTQAELSVKETTNHIAIGNSKSKGSVFHHSEIGEKVTTCRLSVVKFSLARTGLNHTRPVK